MEKTAQGSPNSTLRDASREVLGICQFCELQSVQHEFCMFCHETQIPHENETHKSHVCTQHPQDRDRSFQPATNTGVHGHVAVQEQGRLETQVGGGWPDGSQGCDHPVHEDDLGRSSTRNESQELRGHLGVRAQGTPCCGPQEISSVGLHERQRHGDQPQFNHCFTSSFGGEGDLQSIRTHGKREDEFWQVCRPHIRGGIQPTPLICELDRNHGPGVRQHALAPPQVPPLGNPVALQAEDQPGRESQCQGQGQLHRQFQCVVGGGRGHTRCSGDHGSLEEDPGTARSAGSPSSGTAEAEVRPRSGDPCQHEGSQDPPRDVDSTVSQALPAEVVSKLAKTWHLQRNLFSEQWKSLVHHRRPLLMELACYEDSILGQEVERRYGKNSTIRCSKWNGGDLETKEGVQHAKRMIEKFRPVHLWISCNCAPYCPLQRINQRNESQKQKLEEKRCQVRKQYAGAIEVADFARSFNVQVHWELAERCEAWKLAEIEEFLLRHALKKITCHGCAVGLKTLDGKQALCKGWTIATTNEELLQHLDLRCQRNHPKGRCEGGQTAHTARYTQPFARKVIDSLSACETWSRIVHLLNKEVETALPAEESEDADMPEDEQMEDVAMPPETDEEKREREEIEKKIAHIHRSTGHGNMENLVQALQHRGANEKVLKIARNWKCTTCQRYQRRDPRRFATLEPIPQKWERIQADVATWMHPQTKAKYHVLLVVDEGSRFRIAKVISSGEGNQATWEDMKKVLEENWFSIFGIPKVMKVDPAGPWMSQAAIDYMDERHIEYISIPAEAHWTIGIVENTIKTFKGILTKLIEEFPNRSVDELVARAVWTGNNMDMIDGYTPAQRVFGRAPDDFGRFFKDQAEVPLHPSLVADGGFREDSDVRRVAEQTFIEEQAKRRIERATRMGHRRAEVFLPGDLVYIWRNQVPKRERTTQKSGRFIGPARVLATETRREPDGQLRPGHVVWVHKGGRLFKTAPEQLRKASPYEHMVEELHGPVDLPWTITALASDQNKTVFQDISQERPSDAQWEEAPTEEEEERGVLFRRRSKGPEIRGQKREVASAQKPSEPFSTARGSKERKRENQTKDLSAFFAAEENRKGVEIEWELPSSRRGIKKFINNPEAYVCTQLKRKQVEVREKQLTPSEALEFHKAKETEVKNFIASGCFELAKGVFQMSVVLWV